MKKLIFQTIALILFSCSDKEQLFFSIKNDTKFELKNLIIGFPEDSFRFETLKTNQQTQSKKISEAYQTTFIKFSDIIGRTYKLQPIDHVGEPVFLKGKVLYTITEIDTINLHFKLDFSHSIK